MHRVLRCEPATHLEMFMLMRIFCLATWSTGSPSEKGDFQHCSRVAGSFSLQSFTVARHCRGKQLEFWQVP